MMSIKKYLYNKFLPAWCKDDLIMENAHLTSRVSELKQENARLTAYIDGLEYNTGREIIVNIEGVGR